MVELPVAEFLLQEVPHPSAQVAGLLVAEFQVEEVSPPAAQPETRAITTFGINRIMRCTSRI